MSAVPTKLKTAGIFVSLTSNTSAGPIDSPVASTLTGFDENTKLKLIASARAALVNDARRARQASARVTFFMVLSILRGVGDSSHSPLSEFIRRSGKRHRSFSHYR